MEETRDSFVPQFPVDVAMHVGILEGRVFECCAHGSVSPRERVQRMIDVPAHQVGGEIGKDTPQQCVADPSGGAHVSDLGGVWGSSVHRTVTHLRTHREAGGYDKALESRPTC